MSSLVLGRGGLVTVAVLVQLVLGVSSAVVAGGPTYFLVAVLVLAGVTWRSVGNAVRLDDNGLTVIGRRVCAMASPTRRV